MIEHHFKKAGSLRRVFVATEAIPLNDIEMSVRKQLNNECCVRLSWKSWTCLESSKSSFWEGPTKLAGIKFNIYYGYELVKLYITNVYIF